MSLDSLYVVPEDPAPAVASAAGAPPAEKPVVYDQVVDVRFSDLDPYGHLSTKSYLEYVIASRFTFLWGRFRVTADDCAKRGLAVFITRSEVNYRKAVRGLDSVRVTSWLEPETELGEVDVPFKITSLDGSRVFADGQLRAAVLDPATMKRIAMPAWARPLFYETTKGE